MAQREFKEFFLEEYDVGICDDAVYRECIGFLVGMEVFTEGEAKSRLSQCITVLRASQTFIRVSNRYRAVLPP